MGRWFRFEKIAFLPFRIVIVATGTVLMLYFLLFLFLKSPDGVDYVSHKIKKVVKDNLGLDINLQAIKLDIVTAGLYLNQFELKNSAGKKIIQIKGLNASLSLPYLLFGKVVISEVRIDGIESEIVIKDGKLINFEGIFKDTQKKGEVNGSLPDITIEKFSLSNMNVRFKYEELISAKIHLQELSGSYVAKSAEANITNLNAKVKVEKDTYNININANLSYLSDAIAIKEINIWLDNNRFISVAGELKNLSEPEFKLNLEANLPLSYLKNYPVSMKRSEGEVGLKCAIKGMINSPIAECTIEGRDVNIEQFRIGSFKGDVIYDNGDIQLANLNINNYGNRLTVNASGGIKERIKFIGNVKIDHLELAELLRNLGVNSIVMLDIKGMVDFVFDIDPEKGVVVDSKPVLSLMGPKIFSDYFFSPKRGEPIFNLKAASLSGDVSITEKGVNLKSVDISTDRSRVFVRNSFIGFSGDGYMDIKASSENMDFSDITPLAGLDIRGISTLNARIKGPIPSLKISGDVNTRGFMFEHFYGGSVQVNVEFFNNYLSFKNISGRVNDMAYSGSVILNMNGAPDMEVEAEVKDAQLKNVVTLLKDSIKIKGVKRGRLSLSLRLNGPVTELNGDIHTKIQDVDIMDEQIDSIEGTISLSGGDVILNHLLILLYGGRIEASGLLKKAGEMGFDVKMENIEINRSAFIQSLPIKVSGIFNGSLKTQGSIHNPQMDFSGGIDRTRILSTPIGNISIDANLREKKYSISAENEDKRIRFFMKNDEKHYEIYSINLTLKEMDVVRFFIDNANISTLMDISANLNGDMKAQDLSGSISINNMSATLYDMKFKLKKAVNLTLDRGNIEFSDISISGEEIELNINASHFNPESLNINGSGAIPLKILKALTKETVNASGIFMVDFNVQGSATDPEISINGSLSDSLIKLSFFPHPLENTSLKLFMQKDTIIIDELSGNLAGGKFKGSGTIRLKAFLPENFDIRVDISKAFLSFPRELPSLVNGYITIGGDMKKLLVGGEIDIEKANYNKNIDFNMLLLELTKKRPRYTSYSKENEFVFFDIGLRAPSGIVVKNNLVVDSEFRADLRLVGSNERIGIIGTVNALKGKMVLSGNEYNLKRGIVQFTERCRIAYNLDFVLSTVCHDTNSGLDHNIDMSIGGNDENIQIHYRDNTTPPFSETDIVTCLALGSTPQKVGSQQNRVHDESFGIISSVAGVDQKLKDIIPIPIETFRISSKYSDTLRMNVPQVQVSWKMMENLRLNYSSSLIYSQDQKIELDYKLNRNTSLRTQWNSQAQVPVGNLGVDVRWVWEF
ncbi:MAG: translocation/assembly module TamB domain-containing protein [Myxococcota bacterium]